MFTLGSESQSEGQDWSEKRVGSLFLRSTRQKIHNCVRASHLKIGFLINILRASERIV